MLGNVSNLFSVGQYVVKEMQFKTFKTVHITTNVL